MLRGVLWFVLMFDFVGYALLHRRKEGEGGGIDENLR